MKRNTILPSFDDQERWRSIFSLNEDTRIYAKSDHTPIYAENKWERFISADRWSMSVQALSEFIKDNGDQYSYTSPAAFAASLYRRRFEKVRGFLPVGDFRAIMARRALYGGRCEVYRVGKRKAHQYDINSSYPFSATKIIFPAPQSLEYVTPSLENIREYNGMSEVVFSQDGFMPVLPVRGDGRIYYPVCDGRTGTFTHNELRYALQCGVEVHSITKQYIGQDIQFNPFDEFVNYCYDMRMLGGKGKIWKVIANALFGRMATTSEGILCFRATKDRQVLKETPRALKDFYGVACIAGEQQAPPNSNVLWAAMVLSAARARLHDLSVKFDAVYVDTDCFVTEQFVNDKLPISGALGEFKHKQGYYDIRGAKQYMYKPEESAEYELKMKGVSIVHRTEKDFYASRYTQERIVNDDGTTAAYQM